MNVFDLEIVTPDKQVFAGSVQSVQVPGARGSFQVLQNHAPIISTLGKGRVKVVKEDGGEIAFNTQDGVIEVFNNKAIVLVERILD